MRIIVLILILLLSSTIDAHAQVKRIIKLKNGTIIRGEVISYENEHYIIKSPRYGKIRLKESNIVSIEDSTAKKVYTSITEQNPPPGSNQQDGQSQKYTPTLADLQRIKNQPMAQHLKKRLENDPGLQKDFQNLIENEAVMQTLTNPAVIKALMQRDTQTLMRNQKFQDLINNPDMQKIIQKTLQSQ
ncbi:MAG: hypothetical protein K8S27_09360 [Candidatus Omnitrophica bacterium]|nr:hypothetical protein [Candidatus Omnitrophota bacterium]